MRLFHKPMVASAAILTTGGLIALAGATPAAADEVSATYSCSDGTNPAMTDQPRITITAPADAAVGADVTIGVEVVYTFAPSYDVPPNAVDGSMTITLGSAASGTVTATGLTNSAGTPAGTPLALDKGSASTTFDAPGDVTFTPAIITTSFTGTPITVTCTPVDEVPVAATTHVSSEA